MTVLPRSDAQRGRGAHDEQPFLPEPTVTLSTVEPNPGWVVSVEDVYPWRPIVASLCAIFAVAAVSLAYITRADRKPADEAANGLGLPDPTLIEAIAAPTSTVVTVAVVGSQPQDGTTSFTFGSSASLPAGIGGINDLPAGLATVTSEGSTSTSAGGTTSVIQSTTTAAPTTAPPTTVPPTTAAPTTAPPTTVPPTTPVPTTVPPTTTTTAAGSPEARDDTSSARSGDGTRIFPLLNDTSGTSPFDPYTIRIVSGPSQEKAVKAHSGHIHYESEDRYVGPDELSYEICTVDGACVTATIFIDVTS